jgi:hypothetical protein
MKKDDVETIVKVIHEQLKLSVERMPVKDIVREIRRRVF